jgi:hypothetical protein
MWSRIPIFCRPSVWASLWLAGAATATAYRLPMTLAPLVPHRLRTPLLSLHVSTQKLNPHAGQVKPQSWLKPPLHLVKPGSEDS